MIRAKRPLLLLLAAIFCATAPDASRADAMTIDVPRPAAEETLTIEVPPGAMLMFQFDPLMSSRRVELEDDLALILPDHGRVILKGLLAEPQRSSVWLSYQGVAKRVQFLAPFDNPDSTRSESPALSPSEAPPPEAPPPEAEPELPALRYTGRAVLFSGEDEQNGHPLYSYLLYAGGATGSVDSHRFARAVEAFVQEVSGAHALAASGVARSEINIFYAPIKPFLRGISFRGNRRFFEALTEDGQVEMLQQHYDRARAEVLISNAGLVDNGPFIVSVLRPLSEQAIASGEAFLIQDLSDIPPELVALWVKEFKRQVLQEAAGTPEHLRRFALHLLTTISVTAEAFGMTRSAVAAMLKAPGEPSSGND